MKEKQPVDKLAAQVMRAIREETQGDPVKLGRLIDQFRCELRAAIQEPQDATHDQD